MKRSRTIKLTLLMGATGGLTACGDSDESALLFKDVDECTSFGIEEEACQFQYQQALDSHRQEAPKYASEQLCESDFGFDRCENSSGEIWRPIMAGFMVAALAEAVDEGLDMMKKRKKKKAAYLGGTYYSGAKPLYRSRDDFFSYRNAQNGFVASAKSSGTTSVKSSTINYKPRASSVSRSRGGFGRTASRSSGGSWGS
ncbi:DUF1190 domain-containing protein [Pseudoalteromonas maricaloris]|uniref:DUF1190 domain-containing protein n=1 Tax=Pseudoalteromonas maricaloris TaxID=184924 RepID=UPI00057D2ED1|nr:DUF1190 domain-containing protein [Pseudoalteromonas flavipulchra]KID34272.1 lipoprotein [Pseudoalteromonas flavipulchra NCIMB 2033 = ATCC BAA-314]MBD0784634.1 DUF1190 domain-containing protein [Pseudoalteromonas flavipulchra]MBE0372031.1 hypothetical protein [Pseudoalteromonas flavipulchra NCIMB 2033 = ATCC BAA-314]